MPMLRTFQLLMVAVVITAAADFAANAGTDVTEHRATDLVAALQAGNFAAAETNFDSKMRAALPAAKLAQAWNRLVRQYGPLQSFEIAGKTTADSVELGFVRLNFANGSGVLLAQVAVDKSGQVAGLYFRPPVPTSQQSKVADVRAQQLVKALKIADFAAAEANFGPAMRTALPASGLEAAWRQNTASLGDLESWQMAPPMTAGGYDVRVVDLRFAKAPKNLALKVVIDPAGQVQGLFFVPQVGSDAGAAGPPG
jgi:hypothetical protein